MNHGGIPFFLSNFHVGIEEEVVLVVGELYEGTVVAFSKAKVLFEHDDGHFGKLLLEHLHASIGGGVVCYNDISHAVLQHRGQILAHHVSAVPV